MHKHSYNLLTKIILLLPKKKKKQTYYTFYLFSLKYHEGIK